MRPMPEPETSSRWSTQPGSGQTPGYSKSTFYIHSTNSYNHSQTVRPMPRPIAAEEDMPETITLPPEIYAQIREAVEHPLTEYRSVHDFFRDAAVHRLHDIEEMHRTGFEPFLMQYRMLHELVKMRREDQGLQVMIDAYTEEVESYIAERNPHGITDIINAARAYPVGPRHRLKWLRAIAGWEKQRDNLGQ